MFEGNLSVRILVNWIKDSDKFFLNMMDKIDIIL